MAIPILKLWENYFTENRDEGLGSSYERIILNRKLESICNKYNVITVLEAPVFGFTGLSGINSLNLSFKGHQITLVDHNKKRVNLIRSVWQEVGKPVNIAYVNSYDSLPFSDKSFDLSWNFSALWIVDNLENFVSELDRLTKKVVVLCVPNRAGAGYLTQKYLGRDDLKRYLKEENIIPGNFKKSMKSKGWKLVEQGFIDAPPWPDIGMPKEKLLQKFHLDWLLSTNGEQKEPLTIMDYYLGKNSSFPQQMLHYFWFEKKAPWIVKRFWAHHRYFIFER